MKELSCETAADWLRTHGVATEQMRFRELGGGVSNRVILAESENWRGVLKQSLARLRVEQEWLSDRTRIFREAAAMRWLRDRLKGGRVPRLLIKDDENFTIAMQAAPPEAAMWKDRLFAGEFDEEQARAAGTMLGSMIAVSYENDEARALFGDQTVFDQLRLDPYYRFTASRHPRFAPYFNRLIENASQRAVSLVHGDWSPKNLLVSSTGMWAIDWEVVHFGDPSFDAGFLLNHLLLKSIAMPRHREALAQLARVFMGALTAELPAGAEWIPDAAWEQVPALLLARVDGKSPAEYLDEPMRELARSLAFTLMSEGGRAL